MCTQVHCEIAYQRWYANARVHKMDTRPNDLHGMDIIQIWNIYKQPPYLILLDAVFDTGKFVVVHSLDVVRDLAIPQHLEVKGGQIEFSKAQLSVVSWLLK